MKESMERIRRDFDAFSERVNYFSENISNPDRRKDSCEAAYEGLYKFVQRLKKELESGDLTSQEKTLCHTIAGDNFLNGLLELRTVATHVVSDTARKKKRLQIYVPSGSSVLIPFETSAGSLFSENTFRLPKPSAGITEINHCDNLSTAVARIDKRLQETRRINERSSS